MNHKTSLIVKPTQSGKTFQMLLSIITFFKVAAEENIRRIQLIFVDNNLILANQTAARVQGCEWFEDGENEYLMFSSKSKTTDKKEIFWEITNPMRETPVSNIIMCANNTRFKDAEEIIQRMSLTNQNIFFDIWIDESDKTFSTPKHTSLMERLCAMNNVKSVSLLTATPGANLTQFKEMNVIPMEQTTNSEKYSSWSNASITHVESETYNTLDYAISIIEKYPSQFVSGVRCFIPADIFIETHEEMASMLVNKGFAVLIINGQSCDILLKFGKKRPQLVRQRVEETLSGMFPEKYMNGLKDFQASEWIADIYEGLGLSTFPFAITGNLCIGRGTTLSSAKMFINRAILPPKGPRNRSSKELSLARMYQLAGRITGNTMDFEDWERPIVFCTEMFDECIKTMETRAKRLAEVAFDSGDTKVNPDAYQNIAQAPMTAAENRQKMKDDELELKGSVPIIINVTENEITNLLEKPSHDQKKDYLLGIVGRNIDLWLDICALHCIKISEAGKTSEDARRKYIEAPVSKASNGIKWKADIGQEFNDKDVWLAFIDSKENRIIISVWKGTKHRILL